MITRLDARQRRYAVWMLAVSALMFSLAALGADRYRIAYDGQETRCLPWAWYLIDLRPGEAIDRGALVAYTSKDVRGFPDGTRFLKRVRGVAGDAIAIREGEVSINGTVVDSLRDAALTSLGKAATHFDRAYVLQDAELFVMGETPTSYDSRYTGPIRQPQVMGRAWGLW